MLADLDVNSHNSEETEIGKMSQIQFEFPQKNIQLRRWKTREQLQLYLHKKSIEIGFFQGRLYVTYSLHDKQKMILKCKKCSSKIFTTQQKDCVVITLIENMHRHKLKNHEPQFLSMLRFFQQHSFCLYVDKLHQYFNYDKAKAQKIQNLYYQKFISFDSIANKIVFETGVDLETWKNKGQVYMMLMVTPTMQYTYHRFGHSVFFDVLPRLQILRRSINGCRVWSKIVFMGLDSNNGLVLFGIGFIAYNQKEMFQTDCEVYYLMLTAFYKKMKNLWPETMVSSDNTVISKAIQLLNLRNNANIRILVSWESKLKDIKKQLKYGKYTKEDLTKVLELYAELLKQTAQNVFNQKIRQILVISTKYNSFKTLYNFLHNFDSYCLIALPIKFCGSTLRLSQFQSFNRMLFTILKRQNLYVHCLTLIAYEDILLRRMARIEVAAVKKKMNTELELKQFLSKLQEHITIYRYNEVQRKPFLGRKIFKQLIQNFNYSKTITLKQLDQRTYIVSTSPHFDDPQLITLMKDQLWHCSCMYYEKIGIPCGHLLSIILNTNIKIIKYFHTKYLQRCTNTPYIPIQVLSRKRRRH